MDEVRKYHPALVALHWMMAIGIIGALTAGKIFLHDTPYDDPRKIVGLAQHMALGIGIGILLLIRLAVRLSSAHPSPASTGNAILDRIGRITHWGFYILVAAMVLTGIGSALKAGLFPIVYLGTANVLPPELADLPPRLAHGFISMLLILLIALHAAAALYHQFILKDGLLRRMWFGRRA